MKSHWHVHKFGGSSLANVERFKNVAHVLKGSEQNAIVVSAVQGVTTKLERVVEHAVKQRPYKELLADIRSVHLELIEGLMPPVHQTELKATLQIDLNQIEELLHSISLFHIDQPEIYEIVMGYGEQWAAQILSAYLSLERKTPYLCAYDFLRVEKVPEIRVLWEESGQKFKEQIGTSSFVTTGYIASTTSGKKTTLGRNGSDFSASIIARLLSADTLTIWTDVDGVMSADPRIVPSAFVLNQMSYEEAFELAYFGASVIHPKTMAPVTETQIPIFIRNSFNPEHPGTKITDKTDSEYLIKGITSIHSIALITGEGTGMIGVAGVSARVFQTTHHLDVSVVLITQASSEHSICFAVNKAHSESVVSALKDQFQSELAHGKIQNISAENECSIIAIVGDNMIGQHGVMAKVSRSLSTANVNIKAIAQGSSERNISVVVSTEEVNRGLRAIHSGFHLSNKTLSVGLIGPGLIGKTFLQQLAEETESLKERFDINVKVRGIMNSKHMLLAENEIDLSCWEDAFNRSDKADIQAFINHVKSDEIPHSVIIDCTASQTVSDYYEQFLRSGLHIITPNKKANSGSYTHYKSLRETAKKHQKHFFYETTVGAGLPIIKTLEDLLQTGDHALEIEGIFSGTLAYLFDMFDGTVPFSEIVEGAKQKGYTEPDPRDDLSGMDVARKVITLAREIGLDVSLEDIHVESLVPNELESCDLTTFMKRLPEFDRLMSDRVLSAKEKGESLRYVGFIKHDGSVGVQLKTYDTSHPFGRLKGSDNIVLFKTKRYYDQPLIVQGPGAGAEVTAAGVFSDLLRLVNQMD